MYRARACKHCGMCRLEKDKWELYCSDFCERLGKITDETKIAKRQNDQDVMKAYIYQYPTNQVKK